ncbi:SAM-dependent methyltransferase [Streptacidiphilus sp. P02-A3a]|uniref:SAM-dependent methyltransferase n=1 Tax=Streptacidiphilus sp. P02-A3a TaxID=2704468 RepID=UPI0015FDAEF8|nr:SAM-dependent methyltransferase [Streptacidiphilus sp. P02-A3a]QMU69351.1 SAM-dependent methyltransferase [Streptacidiphilus sp. P02-A3a]
MSETERGPVDLGQDRPHSARMYDYYLGGRTNYAADRAAAERVIEQFPAIGVVARVNRSFMHRATRFLADQGITRFLDIGTGIPTPPNLHEVAQRLHPEARVVYVDNDPLVLVFADALLDSAAQGSTAYVEADVNDPKALLEAPAVRALLADGKPVALSLNALLHFVGDRIEPRSVVETLVEALPSGSYLALSHCTPDFAPEAWQGIEQIYRGQGTYLRVRGHDEVTRLFDGLELVRPGVVVGHQWRPEEGDDGSALDNAQVSLYVGVARKP